MNSMKTLLLIALLPIFLLSAERASACYDPGTQRWINRDPLGESGCPNLYEVTWNRPLNGVDPDGLTFRSNFKFLFGWLAGCSERTRRYGDDSIELKEMRCSPGANRLRDAFYRGDCQDIAAFSYPTLLAARETLLHPRDTSFQVGGFGGASARNNGNGTVTFIIPNQAGANSFFYHVLPNAPWSRGPMRTVNQTFCWTEPIP
jgi:hypothetical protein